MKTLIVYASTHGCTKTCAEKIEAGLTGEKVVVNIKKEKAPDLKAFDQVIIGGSIHAGMVQKKIKSFCVSRSEVLLNKKIGLFLCCMDKEKAQQQFDDAFPEKLRSHASVCGLFGGAFDFDKMKFVK